MCSCRCLICIGFKEPAQYGATMRENINLCVCISSGSFSSNFPNLIRTFLPEPETKGLSSSLSFRRLAS